MLFMRKYRLRPLGVLMAFKCIVGFLVIFGVYIYIMSLSKESKPIEKTPGIDQKFATQIMYPDMQKIGTGMDKLYVYSAFFDDQWVADCPSVTVIAGLKTHNSTPVYCMFFDSEGIQQVATVEATRMNIHLLLDKIYYPLPYAVYYLICNVTNFPGNVPSFVSIVESMDEKSPTNLLVVAKREKKKKYKFTLCLQPIFNFDDAFRLGEWIEYNRMMGVEKFRFYNYSIGPTATCLIKSYGDIIETFRWSSPYTYNVDQLTHAQNMASNDCLQRCKSDSVFMIFADTDEMIMPSPAMGNNFHELISNLEKLVLEQNRTLESVSDYSFRNGLFFSTWNENTDLSTLQIFDGKEQVNAIIKQLSTSKFVLRRNYFDDRWERAKYIALPERIFIATTHYTASMMAPFDRVSSQATFYVSEDLAYNHHYRLTCQSNWCEWKETILDDTGHRFVKDVATRLAEILDTQARHCNITIP